MTVQLVRLTAKELAGADWDSGDHTERFRKFWPDSKQFIARNWPSYVELARALLTEQLRVESTPEHMKQQIYEALVEENTRAARSPKVGIGKLKLNPDHPGRMEQKLFHQN